MIGILPRALACLGLIAALGVGLAMVWPVAEPLPSPKAPPEQSAPPVLVRAYDECWPVFTAEEKRRLAQKCQGEGRSPSFAPSMIWCHERDVDQTIAWNVSTLEYELGGPVFIR